MSYGYGVGDFIAVSRLAWDVYAAYKDAPEDFRNISDEIKSLHIIVGKHKYKFYNKTLTLEEHKHNYGKYCKDAEMCWGTWTSCTPGTLDWDQLRAQAQK